MMTVAEMPEYIRRDEKLLTEGERRDVVDYLASHPKAGPDPGHGRDKETPMGPRRTRQEWRRAHHLLFTQ